MTREEQIEALTTLKEQARYYGDNTFVWSINIDSFNFVIDSTIKALEQEPCEDTISRKSIKQKLQEHHDILVDAYGGFSNLPQNDKSRVDEITNCIAMVVNEPPVTPQESITWIVGKNNAQIAIKNMPIDKLQKLCAIIGDEQEPVLDKIRNEIENYKLSEDELTEMDEDSVKWGMKIACDILEKHER